MKLLPLVHLLAAGQSRPRLPTTFFIDGQNLMGHKRTCNYSETLVEKLKLIQGSNIVLVLDGEKDGNKQTSIEVDGTFQKVSLGEGLSADDYMVMEIDKLCSVRPRQQVQVVTADRQLRRQVLEIKPVVKGVVNPVVFWRRYLPRMCGWKLPKADMVDSIQD
jgi:hypothetical protein